MKNFSLIGVAGYIAPRHLRAIKETNNNLVSVFDPHDSVGILDRYFDNVLYFREFERFDRHADKFIRSGSKIDFVSICSPNYLHDAHIRFSLRIGANAICEKPVVLNPWNIEALENIEKETGQKIYTILQLRLHPTIKKLKETFSKHQPKKKKEIILTYITSRGNWYLFSWKGDIIKSGGLSTNIGIHFFDMLIWLFGKVEHYEVYYRDDKKHVGFLELENARVQWFLSIDKEDLPEDTKKQNLRTYRSITIDREELEFSKGFEDLHIESYNDIISGKGFGLKDTKASIELVYQIRSCPITTKNENTHLFLNMKKGIV